MTIDSVGLISGGRREGMPHSSGSASSRSCMYLSHGGSCRCLYHAGMWRTLAASLIDSARRPLPSSVGRLGPPHSVVRR